MNVLKGATTVSGDLIFHVRKIYELALEDIISGKVVRRGINNYAHHALPAYILSVAAIEAFINESFLSFAARSFSQDEALGILPRDWLEKIEIRMKVLLIPQLLFGKSPTRDSQPYQDFATLVKVRNDLVHYKMQGSPPRYIRELDQRGVTLSSSDDADYLWTHKLSCSEGVRWAHNTACKIAAEIASYENSSQLSNSLVKNFVPITNADVQDWFQKHGIDPNI